MNAARRYIQSSSFKMALLFTLLLGLAVAILGYFSYFFSRDEFVRNVETAINANIENLILWDDDQRLNTILNRADVGADTVYLVIDQQGHRLSGNLPALPREVTPIAEGTLSFIHDSRLYAARIHTFADGRRLLAGIDVQDMANHFERMKWLSILSIALMGFVILVSFLISTFVVSRTSRIATTAENIILTGDLSQRLTIDSKWDDLSYMAGVINRFLERNQQLVQGIQQVTNNIAHDLRTPLTRLRQHLEDIHKHPDILKHPDLQAQTRRLLDETDQVLRTFAALLRIAQIEAGAEHGQFADFDLHQLLLDVIELYEPLAETKKITLNCRLSPLKYHGDRDLLFQIFANLLDNAIKYTPAGGQILLESGETSAGIFIFLTDTGPGIPDTDLDRVFERFFRSDASRHTPGNGLGLALVAAAIQLHQGTIELTNRHPGLQVRVNLPANLTKI